MPLTLPTAPVRAVPLPADGTAPEVPETIPRHGNPNDGRPKIRRPDDPTKSTFYTRASAAGKGIENAFRIHRADVRRIVYGMGRREDLVMRSQAVPTLTDWNSKDPVVRAAKDELTAIGMAAKDAAGGTMAATMGTALHVLSDRQDRGEDLAFVGPRARKALDAWRRLAGRFTVHGAEAFVVCEEWLSAGSYDRLWSPIGPMTAPDGTRITPDDRLIVDLKSGRWSAADWGPVYAVQLATYGHGIPYVHVGDEQAAPRDGRRGDNGRRDWPDGIAPRRDWAIIPHVPLESPDDAALWWVDLSKGRALAMLAYGIREARKVDGLFLPAELPVEAPAQLNKLGLIAQLRAAGSEAELTRLWEASRSTWDDDCTRMVRARLAELGPAAVAS